MEKVVGRRAAQIEKFNLQASKGGVVWPRLTFPRLTPPRIR